MCDVVGFGAGAAGDDPCLDAIALSGLVCESAGDLDESGGWGDPSADDHVVAVEADVSAGGVEERPLEFFVGDGGAALPLVAGEIWEVGEGGDASCFGVVFAVAVLPDEGFVFFGFAGLVEEAEGKGEFGGGGVAGVEVLVDFSDAFCGG